MKKVAGIDVVIAEDERTPAWYVDTVEWTGSRWNTRYFLNGFSTLAEARAFCRYHRLTVREVRK